MNKALQMKIEEIQKNGLTYIRTIGKIYTKIIEA